MRGRASRFPSGLRLVDHTVRVQVALIRTLHRRTCRGHERYRAGVITGPRPFAHGGIPRSAVSHQLVAATLLSAQVEGARVAVVVEGGAAALVVQNIVRVVRGRVSDFGSGRLQQLHPVVVHVGRRVDRDWAAAILAARLDEVHGGGFLPDVESLDGAHPPRRRFCRGPGGPQRPSSVPWPRPRSRPA